MASRYSADRSLHTPGLSVLRFLYTFEKPDVADIIPCVVLLIYTSFIGFGPYLL